MAQKKTGKQTRTKAKRKTAVKATATKRAKQSSGRKVTRKTARPKPKKKRSTASRSKEVRSPEPSTLNGRTFAARTRSTRGGISAGQAGDIQAVSRKALADSESVEELLEEGQAREAAAISGVEDAPDPDEAELHTREVLADDVPEEYTDES